MALGTLAGGATAAQANGFSFSWSTPQGTFFIGPNHPNGHFQSHHVRPHREQIRPRRARRILRQAGFRDISFLRERRNVYVFEARGFRGYRRIAVNKYNGNIIWRWGRR